MRNKLLYIILATLLCINNSHANDEAPVIEFFSFKNGLTTSTVHDVHKDFQGFIWVGTENGLFRYDGYNFRNLNSLLNTRFNAAVFCITEDENHNLWIGTSGKGIFILENRSHKLIHLNLDIKKNVIINQIIFIKNQIWIASSAGILQIDKRKNFNEEKLEFKLLMPDRADSSTQNNIVNCLYYQGGSHVWVGTNAVLYVYSLATGNFTYINSGPQNSIRGLSAYEDKIIAASWDGGIFLVDTLTLKKTSTVLTDYANRIIGDQRVKTVFPDKNKNLHIATYGRGVFVFYPDRKNTYTNFRNDRGIPENIKSNTINHMYLDNSGILWLCMNQPALTKIFYQKDNISFYSPENNTNTISEISSVHPSTDKNKLWVATYGKGIYLFDTKNKSYKKITTQNSSNDFVSLCFQDSKSNLWIVYKKNGLYVIPAKEIKTLLNKRSGCQPIDANSLLFAEGWVNSYITKFYEDSQGRIWIGQWGGLFVVKTREMFQNAQNTVDLIKNATVRCIFNDEIKSQIAVSIFPVLAIQEMRNNEFWIGTLGGGIYSITENAPMRFNIKMAKINEELPQLHVRCILRDKNNALWIGTNEGLCYLKPGNKLKVIKKEDGLTSDDISNLIQGKGSSVWASSFYGAAEFDQKSLSFQNYLSTKNDEINQYLINAACVDSSGMLWLANSGGLVSVSSRQKSKNTGNLPLLFTDIKLNNKTVEPKEKINGTAIIEGNINECSKILVPYNYALNVEFAELNYKNSDQVIYKYRIGKNRNWNILNYNQRNLSFSNLKPGTYRLEIMSADSMNNNQTKEIDIVFLPPFWQSKTAFLLYFIVIMALFMLYRRIAIQKVIQQNEIEKERYERKKLEELDKLKSDFFSSIAHELRTPLSLIISPMEKLASDNDISNNNKEKIVLILKSSNRLLKLVNELMDFSKIEKKSLVPYFQETEFISFSKNIFSLFENIANISNIEYKFQNSIDQVFLALDRKMTEKIIFNLLSNAFKYTPENGTILLEVFLEYGFITLSVINSGEGIDKENIERIFDRYYQVNNVQNRNVEGTGIGLALVKNYVELQSGKVEAVSVPGKETTFTIHLPIKQEIVQNNVTLDNQLINSIEKDQQIQLKETKTESMYHILLVEDEADLRHFIAQELKTEFKISTACNGKEGIKMANELIPDLIITDVMMPVLSGIDLCNTLKNQMETSHIPVIILSAKTEVSEQIEGLEMGADVYMLKPFSLEHLKAQVLRLIQFKEKLYSRYLKDNSIIPEGKFVNPLDEEFMNKIATYLEANLSNSNMGVEQLADCVALSRVQTYRKIKAITGLSIIEFIKTARLKKAVQFVKEGKLSFSEIAFETGFSSQSYFTRCFHEHYGKTPTEYAMDSTKKI